MTTDQPAPADTDESTPEPGRHLAVVEPPRAAVPAIPTQREYEYLRILATDLAASDLVPTQYKNKPANVMLATLAGRPFNWDPTMSMRSFHIIEGVPSMKPEIMLALVRQRGHSVVGEVTGDGATAAATVTGRRADTGDEMTFSFNVDDAVNAGLCSIDAQTKRPRARSNSGKVLPWEHYPKSMCWARALSQVCRMLFPDVVLGAGYTPEELGARISDDDVIDVSEVDGVHVVPETVGENGLKGALVPIFDGDVDLARAAWESRPAEFREGGDAVVSTDDDGKLRFDKAACDAWIDEVKTAVASPEAMTDAGDLDPAATPDATESPTTAATEAGDDDVVDAEIVQEGATADEHGDPGPVDTDAVELPENTRTDLARPILEVAWTELLTELDRETVRRLGEALRTAGHTPSGNKPQLVRQLAELMWPQRQDDIEAGRA